jgi:uncharacterized protein YciI
VSLRIRIERSNSTTNKGFVTMWYLVLSRSVPDKKEIIQAHYEEHRQWLDDQHKAGRMLFSGPTSDRAYGIYVLLASDIEEAESIAAQDSHHRRGLRTMEILEWDPRRAFRMDRFTIADVENLANGK